MRRSKIAIINYARTLSLEERAMVLSSPCPFYVAWSVSQLLLNLRSGVSEIKKQDSAYYSEAVVRNRRFRLFPHFRRTDLSRDVRLNEALR